MYAHTAQQNMLEEIFAFIDMSGMKSESRRRTRKNGIYLHYDLRAQSIKDDAPKTKFMNKINNNDLGFIR